MSAHKPRMKRALPSVPGRPRAETAVEALPSTRNRTTGKVPGSGTNTPVASKILNRGKSVPEICLESSSCVSNSNRGSPRGTRKATGGRTATSTKENIPESVSSIQKTHSLLDRGNLPRHIIPAKVMEEDYSNTEKKVARVLPMTPAFLEENIDCSSPKEIECVGGHGLNNIPDGYSSKMLDSESAPKSMETKWGNPFEAVAFDEEASSVRVAVRLRPFTQR